MTTKRTLYCVTDGRGRFMSDLTSDGPQFHLMPNDAASSDYTWMTSTNAVTAARELQRKYPGQSFGIGLIGLHLEPHSHSWMVVTTQSFAIHTTKDTLVS